MSLVLLTKLSQGHLNSTPHYHDCHQLLFIKEGCAKIVIDNEEYFLNPGSLVITSRFEEHSIEIMDEKSERYIIRISPSAISFKETEYMLLSCLTNRTENFPHVADVSDKMEMYLSILDNMVAEYNKNDEHSRYMLDSLLFQLLIILKRDRDDLFSVNNSSHIDVINKIKSDFSKNYGDEYTLDSVAKKYHMSPSYLAHLFKDATGTPIMDYLQSCRIASSKSMLAKTDLNVSKIVESCGFSNHSNFSRIFKKKTGLTPMQFRNKYR